MFSTADLHVLQIRANTKTLYFAFKLCNSERAIKFSGLLAQLTSLKETLYGTLQAAKRGEEAACKKRVRVGNRDYIKEHGTHWVLL